MGSEQEQQNQLLWKAIEELNGRVASLESKLLAPQERPGHFLALEGSPNPWVRCQELEDQLRDKVRETALLIESYMPTAPATLSECAAAGWRAAIDRVKLIIDERFLKGAPNVSSTG